VTGFEPTQTALLQRSVRVQALPSLQAVPLASEVCVQIASPHTSVVQVLLSLQLALLAHWNPVPAAKLMRQSWPMMTSRPAMAPLKM